jgi:hypothetical protein
LVAVELAAVAFVALLALGVRRVFFGYPTTRRSYRRLRPREIALLRAATDAMFPARGAIPVSGADVDAPAYVDAWFDLLHPMRRFQIRLLLVFFEHATLLFWAPGARGWRRFSALSLQQRIEVLRRWYSSRFFGRRLVFTALRSVLGIVYLGHPATMRFLKVAPYDFPSPVLDADVLYPPIGQGPDAIPYRPDDRTPPSSGEPIDLDGPVHPDYAERPL